MSINRVALRNLSRNRVKTLLSMVAIIIGVAFYIQSECYSKGRRISGFLNLINYEAGAVQIYTKEYFPVKDELPLYASVEDSSQIEEALKDNYYTAPRTRFSGEILSTEKQMQFQIIAVDPEKEKNIFLYPEDISPENISTGAFEMVMGYRGAKELGIDVGDGVRLIAQIEFKEGERIKTITQLLDFTVVGLIRSDNATMSKNTAIVPLDILQDENGMMLNGAVTEIVVREKGFNFNSMPSDEESAEAVAALLPGELKDDLAIKNWIEYDADQMRKLSTNELAPVFFFMTLLIIMLMSNTMLLSVMDRTREIALLRAMGMDNLKIFKLLSTEAGYLGLFGAIIGMIVGFIITYNAVNTGKVITIEYIEARNLGITVTGTIKSVWSIQGFVTAGITAIITSVAAAAFPTISALKMNIIKGIRHE